MKIRMFGIVLVALTLVGTALGDDLPQIETPDSVGLIDPSDAAEAGLVRAGPTPREPVSTTLQSLQQGIEAK